MRALRALLAMLVLCAALAACAADTAVPVGEATTGSQGASGLPTVALAELPPQAQATHALILEGGPYPYPQDDRTFGNREGILPPQPSGWYREYTVETPGSPDRGARRFVVGRDDVFFYTDDHYDSFREVLG